MLSLNNSNKKRTAFSLLEVSITIMIIGVLLVAVIGSRQMIKRSRLLAAQAETRSSPINGTPDNKLWLESALDEESLGEGLSTGDPITSWLDQSLNKDSASIIAVGEGPTYSNSINSIQAVKFGSNSIADHLQINDASFLNGTDYTIIITEKREGMNAGVKNYLLGEDGEFALGYESGAAIIQTHGEASSEDNQTSIENLSAYSGKPRVISFMHSSTEGNKIFVNATLANEDSTAEAKSHLLGIDSLAIGKGYNGEIGEIVIFDRRLRNIERESIEDYMVDKWKAPNNRYSSANCVNGTVTSIGCDPSCSVSINGVIETLVDTGSSGSFSCVGSAYNTSDVITYSCDDGSLTTGVDNTCDCASGYTLSSGAGSACIQGCDVGSIAGSSASGTTVAEGTVVSCDVTGYEPATIGTCSAPGDITGSCACAEGTEKIGSSCAVINCTGGDVVDEGPAAGMRIHTFTTVGASTFSCVNTQDVEVLVVAGGGGGGGRSGWDDGGGGAGAGGLIHSASYLVSSSVPVTVGAGGAGGSATSHETGYSGLNSVFGSITSIGGGGGGSRDRSGLDGGSGGGSGNGSGINAGIGQIGQGNAGYGGSSTNRGGGGGGAGFAATSQSGGDGLSYDISGSDVYYAGGGGGKRGSLVGSGGLGGGGNAGSPGVDGTGGGGGSNIGSTAGFAGGDGVVIVRYFDSNISASEEPSTTCSVSGVPGIIDSTSLGYAPVATGLKCNETGYQGYVTYTCTSSGAASISGSCELTQCSISGVTGLSDTSTLPYAASATSLTCNDAYDGTPTYTCSSSRAAAITGTCTDKLCSISGVTGLTDVTGLGYSTSAVSLECNEGFEGSPTYVCTDTGAATITGSCVATICDITNIDGIEDTTVGYVSSAEPVAYDCDTTGYVGQVSYTCPVSGAAVISGKCVDSSVSPDACDGGIIDDQSASGGPTIHTFISSDDFTCADARNAEILVVAGGGGGGGRSGWDGGGGGAGAGGLIHNASYSISSSFDIAVTVGTGGAGGSATTHETGYSGTNSIFDSMEAIGGGGGGSRDRSGLSGGSGGGSGNGSGINAGSGTSGQGNSGHGGSGSNRGGGGGGAGSAATSPNGGNGLEYSTSGTPTYYAGGGGGKQNSPLTIGTGGLGGGGNAGSPGIDGTGGGGGANMSNTAGFDGGNGIVIVRYCASNLSDPTSCLE